MVIKKKREQVASFDPFLRGPGGEPIGTRDPSPFFTGTGSDEVITRKGTDEPTKQPLLGTFQPTEEGGGRTSRGVATPRGTFFGLTGSELSLLQQQQEPGAKELSGSVMQPIGEAAQQREQAEKQAQFKPAQAGQIPFQPLTSGLATNILGTDQAFATITLNRIAAGKPVSSEDMIALGLTPLDMQVLTSGQAEVNRFAQVLDALPILGRKRFGVSGIKFSIADFVGITPSAKVQKLLEEIKSQAELAAQYKDLAVLSPALANHYIGQIREIEQNMYILESRIKLISIQSPSVQSDPDNLDAITSEVQKSLNSITETKLKVGIV